MVRRLVIIVISLILSFPNVGQAQVNSPDADSCPVNMALSFEEHDAYIMFHARLSHLRRHFGKPTFQSRLNGIIAESWPEERVIEIGATFMERTLNLVDQQYLKDAIASTVGLDHPDWIEFERVMKRVTLFTGLTENRQGGFTRTTQKLITAIEKLPAKRFPVRNLDQNTRDVLKARAITQLANMVIYLERWSEINREITRQKAEAAGKQLLLTALGLTAGGLLVASVVYAGPIVAGAGAFSAKFATDAIVAANLAKLGQIAAGAGMGIAGAPTGLFVADTAANIMSAKRNAINNGTIYACEIDRQMKAWREKGVSPYLNAALVGGSIGAGGGLLTLTKAGARVVLWGTSFGVGIAQLYSLGKLSENSMKSLAEYQLAIDEHRKGNNEAARTHLASSRYWAQKANERALESVIIGVLSLSIGTSFQAALLEGENAIRVIFANSSDTLPLAFGVAADSVTAITGTK